jgi:hypothetical protein
MEEAANDTDGDSPRCCRPRFDRIVGPRTVPVPNRVPFRGFRVLLSPLISKYDQGHAAAPFF